MIRACKVDKCLSAVELWKKNGNYGMDKCTLPSAVKTVVFEERYLAAEKPYGETGISHLWLKTCFRSYPIETNW